MSKIKTILPSLQLLSFYNVGSKLEIISLGNSDESLLETWSLLILMGTLPTNPAKCYTDIVNLYMVTKSRKLVIQKVDILLI